MALKRLIAVWLFLIFSFDQGGNNRRPWDVQFPSSLEQIRTLQNFSFSLLCLFVECIGMLQKRSGQTTRRGRDVGRIARRRLLSPSIKRFSPAFGFSSRICGVSSLTIFQRL